MKKKMLAWVLAAAVTLSSNSMVFAAEGDLFTDAPVQEQWAEADTDESIPEDNPGIDGTGSDGNETGDIKVNIPKSDSIFSNGEIEEGPVAFSDGEKNIFSSGQVMAEGGTSSFINDGAVTVTQTDTTFEVTADAEGNLDFKFNPGETGIYQFTIDEANIFTKENPAEIYSSGASTYKKMGNMFGINIVNVTSEENPCECRLSPVEPGKQYTLTWKKLKEVKKIEAQNIPDQFYKDGVIVGLDSWMREMQCLITYADDNSETIDYAVHEGQEYNLAYTYGIDPGYYHCFLLEGGPTEKYSFKLPISKNDVTKIGQEITLDQTLTQKELLPNYLGQYYCFYFTPSATGTYMIDTKNGRIDNAVNANTGEKISAGSNYNMTEGVTYAFTILPDDISTFAVTMKAAKSISKLEIINPESIPAKVLYGDSDFLRYTKFRITFADENSEELTVYTKSPSGYSLTYSSEHDSNGFIKKGDRQIAFHIGDNDDVEAVANVKVVDNIEELSIPTIQDGTVYNQDNFSPNYGDYYAGIFTAEMNGYFNIETSGLWCDMRDVDSMIPVYSQLFGYKVEAGHSYMMKVYPDSVENWQFKMLFTPEISVTTSTVVSKLNAAGKAKVVFKPTESGDYIIKLQEEAIKKDSEGQDCTTYSLYNGTNGEGGTSGQYSGSFEKDVTYQMTFSNLAEGFSEVSISLAQKKKVSKVEITSGLDEFQKTLVYEDPFASINFSALRFKITYEDSSTREGVKMYEAFSDDETDNYYIYPQYIERPSGYEGEILLLGEYKIGFILFNGFGSTAEMPEPIEVNVKHLSELTEDDFPVIEFGEKYTSTEWTPNYNGKYLFLFKPQYTGVYDLSEIYLNCDSLEVRPTFLEEYDWHTGLYVNGVGMEQGKTYGILLQPSSKPWDFTVYANEKVTGLELVDPNQINGMQVIGELYHSGLFQDLKFKIKYLDKKGQEQETESFHDFGSVIYPEDFVDRTIVTPGAIQAEFCLERMKGINQKYNVDVVSLKDVTDTLPEISENTVRTDLPDNYNNGKCFNFTPETDGAYTFSFGGESCFGAYAADGAFVKEWGGEHWRLDAKAG